MHHWCVLVVVIVVVVFSLPPSAVVGVRRNFVLGFTHALVLRDDEAARRASLVCLGYFPLSESSRTPPKFHARVYPRLGAAR